MNRHSAADFRWIPGLGPDACALDRLRKRFPRPASPMGEAWFMSERRRMFDALMAPDPAGWPADEIKQALEECSSGPVSFGHMTEWSDWFPYLLHTAIDHVGPWDPASVYGGLVTNMMVHCPNEAACSSYGKGLIEDVLLTVGRVPMAERFWSGDRMLDRSAFQPVQVWPVGMIVAYDSDLHAAFWLMAKYLPLDRLEVWLRSVMAIGDPAWGCGVLSWLAHAERVFEVPARWPGVDKDQGGTWSGSHLLFGVIQSADDETQVDCGPFLEDTRVITLLSALGRTLDSRRLDAWCEGLATRGMGQGTLIDAVDEADRLRAAVLRRYRHS